MTERMTVEGAGRKLRQTAELTAQASKNCDNFEEIATEMLRQAFHAGKANAYDELTAVGGTKSDGPKRHQRC